MWYFTFDQSLPHSYGLEVQKQKQLESNGDPLSGGYRSLEVFNNGFERLNVSTDIIPICPILQDGAAVHHVRALSPSGH